MTPMKDQEGSIRSICVAKAAAWRGRAAVSGGGGRGGAVGMHANPDLHAGVADDRAAELVARLAPPPAAAAASRLSTAPAARARERRRERRLQPLAAPAAALPAKYAPLAPIAAARGLGAHEYAAQLATDSPEFAV